MTCWIVIPAKAPAAAKSRLAGTLDGTTRERLAEAMLDRVVAAAIAAVGREQVVLVGDARLALPRGIQAITEPGRDLGRALALARAALVPHGASRMVTLAGDLPLLTPQDVSALADLPGEAIGIAPDRHGTGTNALSLPLPAAAEFRFAFGPGSYARHLAEAARLGLEARTIALPGLARDIDEPADLADAATLLDQSGVPHR